MALQSKPIAIEVIEKANKIEIGDSSNKNWIGGNTYTLNEMNQVEILRLTNIRVFNQLRFGKLLDLKRLVIYNSSFKDLTSLRSICPNLEYLELAGNKKLEDITGLKYLKNIKYLDISRTGVWDLSPIYELLKSGSLQELNAKATPLRFPPSEIIDVFSPGSVLKWFNEIWERPRQLIRECLKSRSLMLDLGYCGITDLSHFPELFECTHLERLILSNEWPLYENGDWELIRSRNEFGTKNNLFYIPNKLINLTKLTHLFVSGDWNAKHKNTFWNRGRLKHFHIFTKFKELAYLNVSNQEIIRIANLEKLTNLRILHINNNRIRNISIKDRVSSLTELFASNNFLSDIEFLNRLPNLNTVDLHNNSIKNLFPVKDLIKKIGIVDGKWAIGTISLAKNNTLRLPKYATIGEGTQSVLDYFDRWEKEQDADLAPFINNDVKVILVGNSSVGKSTLAHWLTTNQVDLNLKSTHWLNRIPWRASLRRRNFNIHLFDFGGQEYYHDTHHLFFTTDTVYVLLWDKKPDSFDEIIPGNSNTSEKVQTYPLDYWLDSIEFFTKRKNFGKDELKINKLIANLATEQVVSRPGSIEVEQREVADKDKDILQDILVFQSKVHSHVEIEYLQQYSLHYRYPRIYDFANFSLSNDRSLQHIRDLLFEVLSSMPLLGQPMLGSWGAIKSRIESSVNKFKKEFTVKSFQAYCNNIIKDLPELVDASEDKLRRLMFDEANTRNFASYLSKIGLILYFPENPNLQNKIFPNQNYLIDQIHDALTVFAQGNGIAGRTSIGTSAKKPLTAKELRTLIDIMIHFKISFEHPADESILIAPLYLPKEPIKAIQIFLPQFSRPLYRYIFKAFIHRNVILEFFAIFGKDAIHEKASSGTYYFWRDGLVLKDEVTGEVILVRFENNQLKDDQKQACIDVFSLNGKKGDFIKNVIAEIDRITADRRVDKCVTLDGKEFIPLKDIVYAENNNHYVFKFQNSYHRLVDFKEFLTKPTNMKNIFISYSKDDLPMVNTFIKHLSALQRDGTVGHWYCTELRAGEDWNDEIQQQFKSSDIICFMVSPNFMKTQYIFEHEIKKAFERKDADPSFKIVPIILDFCRWTTKEYNLGTYTALPYTAKPIVDFRHQNLAWYLVEEAIRIMIDDENAPLDNLFYTYQKLPKDVLEYYERIAMKGDV